MIEKKSQLPIPILPGRKSHAPLLRAPRMKTQRRLTAADTEWRKSSLSVLFKGFQPSRGTYSVIVTTTTMTEGRPSAISDGASSGGGSKDSGIKGGTVRMREVDDKWVLSYVLAPPTVSSFERFLRLLLSLCMSFFVNVLFGAVP